MKHSTLKNHGEDLMSVVIRKPSPGGSAPGPADGALDTAEDISRMESALLQARALIESTVSLHRTRPVRESLVLRMDDADIGGTVTRLVGLARHSVSVSLTAGESASTVFDALAAHASPSKERAAGGGANGPVIRLLCTPQAVNSCRPSAEHFRDTRCEIRVDEGELRGMLIVDSRVALMPDPPGKGYEAAIIKDTASARALDLMFAGSWANARSLAEHQRTSARMRTESVRRILEQLCEGRTDEVAARELRVSLRTYRRHVAEIMQELGANSRFQAGARAVEMALLPQRTDAPGRESRRHG
ncbi:LuxR family transcriptional regulator [Streptomyces sp. NPDC127091]